MAFIPLNSITNVSLKNALSSADGNVAAYNKALAQTHQATYVMLGDAYTISQTFDKAALQKAAKELDIAFQKTASAESLALKLVCRNADSAKVSAWALVLTNARELKVDPKGFVKWVEDKGGIEKIRSSDLEELAEDNKANKSAAMEIAVEAMRGERPGAFLIDPPNKAQNPLPVNKTSKRAVWLVQESADGKFELVAVSTAKQSVDSFVHKVGLAIKRPANVKDFKVVLNPVVPKTDEQDQAKSRIGSSK